MALNRIDFNGLNKKYIYERLNQNLGSGNLPDVNDLVTVKFIEPNIQIENNVKPIMKPFVRIAFKYKEEIKQIPFFSDRILKIKRKMLDDAQGSCFKERLDLSGLIKYEDGVNFIINLYQAILHRVPDKVGEHQYLKLLASGYPKEAIVYLIAISAEHGNRYEIVNLDRYKITYRTKRLKDIIKRVPVASFIINSIKAPSRIDDLSKELNVFIMTSMYQVEKNSYLIEKNSNLIEKNSNLIEKNSNLIERNSHQLDELAERIKKIEKNLVSDSFKLDSLNKKNDVIYKVVNDNTNLNNITKILELNSNLLEEMSIFTKELSEENYEIKKMIKKSFDNMQRNIKLNQDRNMQLSDTCGFDRDIEKSIIGKVEIDTIRTVIETNINMAGNMGVYGHFENAFFSKQFIETLNVFRPVSREKSLSYPSVQMSTDMSPEQFVNNIKKMDTLIVSNSEVVNKLFKKHLIGNLANKISDTLALVIPYNSLEEQEFTINWGEGFDPVEKASESYFRWFTEDSVGKIYVLNRGDHKQAIEVNFTIASLDYSSRFEVQFNGVLNDYAVLGGEVTCKLIGDAYPGINEIAITHYGNEIILGKFDRKLRYCIKNLSINISKSDNDNLTIASYEAYKNMVSFTELELWIKDKTIRTELHKQGFFEVDKVLVGDNQEVVIEQTSRFSYQNGYRMLGTKNDETPNRGIEIYFARRKGANYIG